MTFLSKLVCNVQYIPKFTFIRSKSCQKRVPTYNMFVLLRTIVRLQNTSRNIMSDNIKSRITINTSLATFGDYSVKTFIVGGVLVACSLSKNLSCLSPAKSTCLQGAIAMRSHAC
jgi:hypothetical protein